MMEPQRRPAGPPESVRAAAAALPSRRHAEMLYDAVVALIGSAGWEETANGGAMRRLFRRDPHHASQIVPWPVLELSIGRRFAVVTDWVPFGVEPIDVPPPPPAKPPKLRGLGAGEIRLVDGPEHIEIVYGDDGAKLETCRSHHRHPLAALPSAVAAEGGNPTELLAQFIAGLAPTRHGPGCIQLPVAMPHGAQGVWCCGLGALRRALFEERVGRGARWAVADGMTGTAVASGETREEALSRWRTAVAERLPWPEPQSEPETPPDLPPGTMTIRAPEPDVPLPDAVPANVPAVLVPIEPAPAAPPTFGSWITLLGAYGATFFAACRRKRAGFTLIGREALEVVDFERLDAEMDCVDDAQEEQFLDAIARTPGGAQRWPCRTTTYRVRDDGGLVFDSSHEGPEWRADHLDGDAVVRRVVRQRWVQ